MPPYYGTAAPWPMGMRHINHGQSVSGTMSKLCTRIYFNASHQPRTLSRSVFMSRMSLANAFISSKISGCTPKRKLGRARSPRTFEAKNVTARAAEADGVTSGKPKKSLEMVSSSDACDDSIGPTTWQAEQRKGRALPGATYSSTLELLELSRRVSLVFIVYLGHRTL